MVILVFLLVILTSLLGTVSRAWNSSEQQVGTFQDGRAILDIIGRELSQAAISPSLQFVATSRLANSRTNSDSIFWQAPLTYRVSGSATPITNICEVGYYIDSSYNLKRFFIQPADSNFRIYSGTPSDSGASWVTGYMTTTGVSNIISTGVVAFWIRCLDSNGDPIPWVSSSFHFNSAAHFQQAILGSSNSFKYTASSTAAANLLPTAVELTLVLVDDKTLRKNLTIPAMPTVSAPAGVPTAIANFNNTLITNRISAARTFTAQIAIPNSFRQ